MSVTLSPSRSMSAHAFLYSALTLVGESDRKLVKLAMKHAPPESIKQRVIPPEVINEVTQELKELEGEVKAVQREEKEEKEASSSLHSEQGLKLTLPFALQYRKGDMELTKGRNLIEHQTEIMARPARTWFQTTQEKQIAKSESGGFSTRRTPS